MFIVMLLMWLVFVGGFSLSAMIMGAVISSLITLFCIRFMGYSTSKFLSFIKKAGKFLLYIFVLLKEIVAANIMVLKLVYRRAEPKPMLLGFHSELKSEALQVLVANSITLTPGTYTVELDSGDYLVHALDTSLADGIEDCVFFREAQGMEES